MGGRRVAIALSPSYVYGDIIFLLLEKQMKSINITLHTSIKVVVLSTSPVK